MSNQEQRAALWKKQERWKAELTLKQHQELVYVDCVALLLESLDTRSALDVHDPAFETFTRAIHNYRSLCVAHAVLADHADTHKSHLVATKAIWSYNKGAVVEEVVLWIPFGTRPKDIDWELKIAGTLAMARAGMDPNWATTLEVVQA